MKKRIYLNQMKNQYALRAVIQELAKLQFASSVPFFPTKASLNDMLQEHVGNELRIAYKTIWDFCQYDCWQGELFWKEAKRYYIVPENHMLTNSEKGVFHYTEKNIHRIAGNIFRNSFPEEMYSEHVCIMKDIQLVNKTTGHYVIVQGDEIALGVFWECVKDNAFQLLLDFIENYIPLHINDISSISRYSGIVFTKKIQPERNAVIDFAVEKGLPSTGWIEK